MILLFTDGLYKVIGEEQEEFGQERLIEDVPAENWSCVPPNYLMNYWMK